MSSGFNPGFINREGSRYFLPFPNNISLMEIGIGESRKFKPELQFLQENYKFEFSLHIARSPISENSDEQISYIKKLKDYYKVLDYKNIGFHLTGRRSDNIGRYGFSSSFDPNNNSLAENAKTFLCKVRDVLKIDDILIENVNYYSPDRSDVFGLWQKISNICMKEDIGLIFDLSHHFVNCANAGIPIDLTLGIVPWNCVKGIHLSGITKAGDGSFHDGHSNAVLPVIWELFEKIMTFYIPQSQDIFVTIEHTDISWCQHPELFQKEFQRLLNYKRIFPILEKETNPYYGKQEKYARSRLVRQMQALTPKIARLCADRSLSYELIASSWLETLDFKDGEVLVLGEDEVTSELTKNCCALFSTYFHENYIK